MSPSSLIATIAILNTIITLASSSWTNDSIAAFEKELKQQDKSIQRAICIKNSVTALQNTVSRLTCVERNSPKGTFRQYKLIFINVTGHPSYPEMLTDWKRYICTEKYFLTLKDLVDLSFLISLTQDNRYYNVMDMIHRRYMDRYYGQRNRRDRQGQLSPCPHITDSYIDMIIFARRNKYIHQWFSETVRKPRNHTRGINGTEDSYLPTIDKCDRMENSTLDPYCIRKDAYMKNVTIACQNITHSNSVISKMIVNQQRCLERTSTHRSFRILKSCWQDVVASSYPKSDQDFLQFFCGHTYPNALRRIIDFCYSERKRGAFVKLRNWVGIKVNSRDPCTVPIVIESEKTMLTEYRKRYLHVHVSWQRKQVCLKRNKNVIRGVFLDASCPYRSSTPRIRLFLKFCWRYAAQMDMPVTTTEWISLLCNESQLTLQKIEHQVSRCFSRMPQFLYANNNPIGRLKWTGDMVSDLSKRYQGCSRSLPLVGATEDEEE